MAKKAKPITESLTTRVELKDPDMVLDLPRIGFKITKDNLTFERYQKLILISPSFKEFFNLKLSQNEMETKE